MLPDLIDRLDLDDEWTLSPCVDLIFLVGRRFPLLTDGLALLTHSSGLEVAIPQHLTEQIVDSYAVAAIHTATLQDAVTLNELTGLHVAFFTPVGEGVDALRLDLIKSKRRASCDTRKPVN